MDIFNKIQTSLNEGLCVIIFMIGLPGSGKTTLANKMVNQFKRPSPEATLETNGDTNQTKDKARHRYLTKQERKLLKKQSIATPVIEPVKAIPQTVEYSGIVSADSYFMDGGVYKYVPGRIQEVHASAQECLRQYLDENRQFIIIDNTNLNQASIDPYQRVIDIHAKQRRIIYNIYLFEPNLKKLAERNTKFINLEIIESRSKALCISHLDNLFTISSEIAYNL